MEIPAVNLYTVLENLWYLKPLSTVEFALSLSNGPSKKDSTRGNGMRKGANFCTTLLLFYHTSDWLNQQNLPKLQVAVYLFILN